MDVVHFVSRFFLLKTSQKNLLRIIFESWYIFRYISTLFIRINMQLIKYSFPRKMQRVT